MRFVELYEVEIVLHGVGNAINFPDLRARVESARNAYVYDFICAEAVDSVLCASRRVSFAHAADDYSQIAPVDFAEHDPPSVNGAFALFVQKV